MSTFSRNERSVVVYNKAYDDYRDGKIQGVDRNTLRGLKEALTRATRDDDERIRFIHEFRGPTQIDVNVATGTCELNGLDASADEIALRRTKASVTVGSSRANLQPRTMLPTCAKARIAVPEVIVRGPLFGLGSHRKVMTRVGLDMKTTYERISFLEKGQLCASIGDVSLYYHGSALDQADFDVWIVLLDLAKDDLTNSLSLTLGRLLALLGRTGGGVDYKVLETSLIRLALGCFSYKRGSTTIIDDKKLLSGLDIDSETRMATITLHAEMAQLFGSEKQLSWTTVQREQRKALSGKPLALWLHAFYSSHAKPIPITLKKLQESCGSQLPASEFRRSLVGSTTGGRVRKGALDALVAVGFLQDGYRIDTKSNKLSVTRDRRSLSSSQSKAIA